MYKPPDSANEHRRTELRTHKMIPHKKEVQ